MRRDLSLFFSRRLGSDDAGRGGPVRALRASPGGARRARARCDAVDAMRAARATCVDARPRVPSYRVDVTNQCSFPLTWDRPRLVACVSSFFFFFSSLPPLRTPTPREGAVRRDDAADSLTLRLILIAFLTECSRSPSTPPRRRALRPPPRPRPPPDPPPSPSSSSGYCDSHVSGFGVGCDSIVALSSVIIRSIARALKLGNIATRSDGCSGLSCRSLSWISQRISRRCSSVHSRASSLIHSSLFTHFTSRGRASTTVGSGSCDDSSRTTSPSPGPGPGPGPPRDDDVDAEKDGRGDRGGDPSIGTIAAAPVATSMTRRRTPRRRAAAASDPADPNVSMSSPSPSPPPPKLSLTPPPPPSPPASPPEMVTVTFSRFCSSRKPSSSPSGLIDAGRTTPNMSGCGDLGGVRAPLPTDESECAPLTPLTRLRLPCEEVRARREAPPPLRVVPYKATSGWSSKASGGVERRRGRVLNAGGGRRDTPAKVLKDRRSPRQRGSYGNQCIERTSNSSSSGSRTRSDPRGPRLGCPPPPPVMRARTRASSFPCAGTTPRPPVAAAGGGGASPSTAGLLLRRRRRRRRRRRPRLSYGATPASAGLDHSPRLLLLVLLLAPSPRSRPRTAPRPLTRSASRRPTPLAAAGPAAATKTPPAARRPTRTRMRVRPRPRPRSGPRRRLGRRRRSPRSYRQTAAAARGRETLLSTRPNSSACPARRIRIHQIRRRRRGRAPRGPATPRRRSFSSSSSSSFSSSARPRNSGENSLTGVPPPGCGLAGIGVSSIPSSCRCVSSNDRLWWESRAWRRPFAWSPRWLGIFIRGSFRRPSGMP